MPKGLELLLPLNWWQAQIRLLKNNAYLELDLLGDTNKAKISLEEGPSSWRYFHNVYTQDVCKVITPMSGEDRLRCQLMEGWNHIVINFEIFSGHLRSKSGFKATFIWLFF
ncbi:hypothetical protein OVS_02750 [Mycoplasma ovis str. Michigan]|uniref:Uncharacterized protein n=1 Tax=Mycoplasma ovis str. Michigan TaxID=1415773 RepID=A0ABM5P1L3_9MOLU|nr:hypothetical protein OVS_02750 [Mycoplasma ovis str. Michigan]